MPFFLLIAAGAVIARTRLLPREGVKGLSVYVLWLGFPALLIRSLGTAPPPEPAMARGLVAYGVSAVLLLGVALAVGRFARWSGGTSSGAGMAGVVGNTAFLGAPLAVSVFGPSVSGLAAGVIAVDFVVIMAFAMGAMQATTGAGSVRLALGRTFLNPVVAAAILGAVLSFTGVQLPVPLARGLDMMAASASPVGLVALGAVIGLEAKRPTRGELGPIGLALGLKLVAMPALVWVAVTLAGAPPAFRAIAVLLAGCPTAVNVFIQAGAYSDFGRGAAQVVVLGTLVSAATLPLIAAAVAE
ncbi:AEC family transporter [Chondromyces crocatus]|uniref:AEC family transporter n=1 Tax=Chondromyces crocatus TaxID=52 RepID=UPI00316AC088